MVNNLLKKNKGFTLIEIIVVLVILAILAAAAIPTMIGFIVDSKEKLAHSNIGVIRRSLVSAAADVDVKNFQQIYLPAPGYDGNDDENKFYRTVKNFLDPDFKGQYYILIDVPKGEQGKNSNINNIIEKYTKIYYGESGWNKSPSYKYDQGEITKVN